MTVGLRNPERVPDSAIFGWGTHGDVASSLRPSGNAANTAVANLLLGTPVSQALANNSLVLSNITASGDMGFYVKQGDNSYEWLMSDASLGKVHIGHGLIGAAGVYATIGPAAALGGTVGENLADGLVITERSTAFRASLVFRSENVTHNLLNSSGDSFDTKTYGAIARIDDTSGGWLVEGYTISATGLQLKAYARDSAIKTTRSTTEADSQGMQLYRVIAADASTGAEETLPAQSNAYSWSRRGASTTQTIMILGSEGSLFTYGIEAGVTSMHSVENTDTANAASHAALIAKANNTSADAYVSVQTAANQWYMGIDNTDLDRLIFGAGVAVGTTPVISVYLAGATTTGLYSHYFTSQGVTLTDGAGREYHQFGISASTVTFAGQTQVTSASSGVQVAAYTLTQSGGAVTVNAAYGVDIVAPTLADVEITLTDGAALHIANATKGAAATYSNQEGILIDALSGASQNYQILMANGGTEPAARANYAGVYAIDLSADNATIGFVTEHATAVSVATASTHKWGVRINGATYYILLSNV